MLALQHRMLEHLFCAVAIVKIISSIQEHIDFIIGYDRRSYWTLQVPSKDLPEADRILIPYYQQLAECYQLYECNNTHIKPTLKLYFHLK